MYIYIYIERERCIMHLCTYVYRHVYIYIYIHSSCTCARTRKHSYEEFTRLAETGLAQNTLNIPEDSLNCIELALTTLNNSFNYLELG